VVPVYDGAGTIGDALESVLSQQPPPLEVIVSDDGSRDDLGRALGPFASRVHVVRGPNAGPGVARNRAAATASGDLLALLDADDVWLPGRLQALSAVATARPDLDVLTTDAVVHRGGVRTATSYYDTRSFEVADQVDAILRESFVFGAGAVRLPAFRAVGGYSATNRIAEDWDLWLRLLLTGSRAGLVRAPLYEYRRRGESITGQKVDLALGVLQVLGSVRALVRDPAHRETLRATEQRWREQAARAAVLTQDPRRRRLAARAAVTRGTPLRIRVLLAGAAVAPSRMLAWKRTAAPS